MKSCFSFSAPFFLTVHRKYGVLPIVATAILICTGVFPILLLRDGGALVWQAINGKNPIFLGVTGLVPVISGTISFRFLHLRGAIPIIFSLPASRGGLYLSGFTAGLSMTLIPFIVNAVAFLPFVSFTMKPAVQSGTLPPDIANLLQWALVTLTAVIFIYALTVAASVMSGNLLISLVMDLFLNCAAPLVYVLGTAYFTSFLLGFGSSPMETLEMAARMHPLTLLTNAQHTPGWILAVFCGASLTITLLAGLLFRWRRPESGRGAIVFSGLQLLTTTFVTLVGMSAFGFLRFALAQAASEQHPRLSHFYFGAVFGAVFTFVITRMVIEKSFRILNEKTLRSLGCALTAGILFMILMTTDVSGFERHLPRQSQVISASLTVGNTNLLPWHYGNASAADRTLVLKEGESIQAIMALHRTLSFGGFPAGQGYDFPSGKTVPVVLDENRTLRRYEYGIATIQYEMNHGKSLRRQYYPLNHAMRTHADFRKLYETKEFKESMTLKRQIGYDRIVAMDIRLVLPAQASARGGSGSPAPAPEGSVFDLPLRPSEFISLAETLDGDYRSLPFDALQDDSSVRICFFITCETKSGPGESRLETVKYYINSNFTESIRWLGQHQIYEDTLKKARQIWETAGESP